MLKKDFICNKNIDVMAICETKISEKINLSMQGYNIIRKDRNRHGGGVLLIIKNFLTMIIFDNING